MKIDETAIRSLYGNLINGWNEAAAEMMTKEFADDALMIGFDGSEVVGHERARKYLASIFADHQVASFVTLVREIKELADDVALLRAHAGMVPPGKRELMPERNAVQSLLAVKHDGTWRIALFQTTPAEWHGRQDDVQALTRELQAAFDVANSVAGGVRA